MKKLWFIFSLIILPLSSTLGFEVTAVGGLNFAAPTQITSGVDQHWVGKSALSYGILIAHPILQSSFDFETGAVLLSSQYEQTVSGQTNIKTQNSTLIPLIIRYNFDERVGLGAGAYLSYARGNRDEALSRGDQGVLVSLRANFNLFPLASLILDARYQHGLANMAVKSSDLFNTRSVQFLTGICFSFSKDHANPEERAPHAGPDL